MLIPNHHTTTALDKAKEMADSYQMLYPTGGAHTLKSVSVLVDVVKSAIDGALDIVDLKEQHGLTTPARGFFLGNKDGDYTIALLGGQNLCWTRLVLCKELFHVLLDTDESRNIFVASHLDDYLYSQFPGQETMPKKGVISEFQAEFAAMDFLFPYADRALIAREPYNSAELAERYKVPKVMIEKYLSDRYMANMLQFVG
jgi:hypothetical protein